MATVFDFSTSCLSVFNDCDPPTGTVDFYAGGVHLGSAGHRVASSGDDFSTFRLDYCCLTTGTHEILAAYRPAEPNHFISGFDTVTHTVHKASTDDVVLSQSSATTDVGQPVTFTATIFAGTANTASPTGTVQFADNGAPLGGPVPLSGGTTVQTTTSSLSPGTHTISAQYSGDSNYLPDGEQIVHTVQRTATTVSLTSDKNPSTVGTAVQLYAIVNETGSGTPTGTVTFKDGATTLATVPLVDGFVFASFSTSALAVGTHSITAVYSGDANFTPSTSAVLTQTVVRHQTTVALTSSANPSVPGQPVTFRAVVTTSGPGTPTGTLRFESGVGDAATTLGTASLTGGMATLTTSTLGAGTHTVTAVYEGDTSHSHSQSAALTQTVVACTITAPLTGGSTVGTPGNDVICGSSAADDVAGLGGDDIIVGFGGNDRLFGGDGNDTLWGGDGNDQLSGGAGNDKLYGDGGTDYAAGAGGMDACLAEHLAECEA